MSSVYLYPKHWVAHTYLDLFVGGDSTEDDLCEALDGKHAETDPSYHLVVFHQCQALVFSGHN